LDVNSSEIVYGGEGKEGSTLDNGSPYKDDVNMSIDGFNHKDSSAILMNAPTSKKS
jgi:hypothetical protein